MLGQVLLVGEENMWAWVRAVQGWKESHNYGTEEGLWEGLCRGEDSLQECGGGDDRQGESDNNSRGVDDNETRENGDNEELKGQRLEEVVCQRAVTVIHG